MHLLQILILAIIQGATEMLPVSSSAHVTIASKLMHFDRGTKYDWAFLLIMLHTGNMLAVIYYFRARWKSLWKQLPALILATVATGIVGLGLYIAIKRFALSPGDDIEDLFTRLPLIAAALAAVGIVIIAAWLFDRRTRNHTERVGFVPAMLIGIVQGIALAFRGFSRSGSTISAAMFCRIDRIRAEEFSFALSVLLTPAVILFEARHFFDHTAPPGTSIGSVVMPSLAGMVFSFFAGLVGLRWLSRWLERGRWQWFGGYCLVAAAIVVVIHVVAP